MEDFLVGKEHREEQDTSDSSVSEIILSTSCNSVCRKVNYGGCGSKEKRKRLKLQLMVNQFVINNSESVRHGP